MCGPTELAQAFRCSKQSIHAWRLNGAPINKGTKTDVRDVIEWRLSRDSEEKGPSQKSQLEMEKLRAQIDRLKGQNAREQEMTMPKTEHASIMALRARSLSEYWERNADAHAVHFAGLSIDEAREQLHEWVKVGLNVYSAEAE